MIRIICPTAFLAGVCIFGFVSPAMAQAENGVAAGGEELLASPVTVTGKLVFTFTITVASTNLTGDTVVCNAVASLDDSIATGGTIITESASVGVKEASTVSCTVTIPYSWTLATMSTDKVSLSYTISTIGATATTVVPNRTSSHSLGSISVPASGATTTHAIKATI
jgi:hypothetical protein